ncbi:MAG: PilZ domain-containing protein [Myxococcales bacterium]
MQPQTLRTKRQHPRVQAGFLVKMHVGAREVLARARDLSMAGMFLDGPLSRLPSEIDVRIPLPGQDREVQTTCRVERTDSDGVALSFSKIDWGDLLLMARYLSPRL